MKSGGCAARRNERQCLLIVLSLPKGRIRNSYGSWDRYVF